MELTSPGEAMNKERGFSLIELLIVVAIILIIAAIAIPNLLRSRIAANEASAVSSVRTINTAELTYSASWGAGYSANVAALGGPPPCAVPSAAAACIIGPDLSVAPFMKSGYTFGVLGNTPAGGANNGFEVNATPVMVDVTGKRAFCADQTGVIRFNTTGAAIGLAPGSCFAAALLVGN